jgi:predicted lipase
MQFALECCEMAYKDNVKKFKDYDCIFLDCPSHDAQGYMFHTADTTVIAFRGTSSFKDAITDFNAFSVPWLQSEKARLHKGFFEQYMSLRKQIIENLKHNKICLTGHSLGGALSQIAALDLSLLNYNVSCIHFGSPRVGNLSFAKLLAERVPDNLAVVHALDPIPQLPSCFGWWKHPKTKRLEISKDVFTAEYEDTNAFWFSIWNPAKAHSLASYQVNL